MTYFPEISLLMSLNGTLLIEGKELSEPIKLPNPFGGNSFNAINTKTISKIHNGTATISSSTIVNEQSLNEGMNEILKSMSPSNEENEELPTFNMTNSVNYIFDVENSKMLEINTEKQITFPGRSRIDKLKIKEI